MIPTIFDTSRKVHMAVRVVFLQQAFVIVYPTDMDNTITSLESKIATLIKCELGGTYELYQQIKENLLPNCVDTRRCKWYNDIEFTHRVEKGSHIMDLRNSSFTMEDTVDRLISFYIDNGIADTDDQAIDMINTNIYQNKVKTFVHLTNDDGDTYEFPIEQNLPKSTKVMYLD